MFGLTLQALAAVAVACTALTIWRWWGRHIEVAYGERIRLGLLLAGGLVFSLWAADWGLLVP